MINLNADLYKCEDGSYLLEVYGKDFRIAMIADKSEKDSGWFVVSKNPTPCALGGITGHEDLYNAFKELIGE